MNEHDVAPAIYGTITTVPLSEILGLFRLYVDDYFAEDGRYLVDDWFENRLSVLLPENLHDDVKDLFYAEVIEPLTEDFKQHLYCLQEYLDEEQLDEDE